MPRRHVIFAAAASLLLCVTTIVLWVRSHFVCDLVFWNASGHNGVMWSNDGILHLQLTASAFRGRFSWHYQSDPAAPYRHLRLWRRIVPTWRAGPGETLLGRWDRVLTLPYWLVLLVPVLALFGLHRHRRAARGSPCLCTACGYDLRATPERCPECGGVPAAAAAR